MRSLTNLDPVQTAEILALELERRSCPTCRPGVPLCGHCRTLVRRAETVVVSGATRKDHA